ncbi:cryptochrome/photolyase family protein [Lentibacter sp. XHP0401]|uniref:cryptochrome/photolyase family protein n=1 Tax=Lentibacter sp. XHP0401 TaxID=2984334 RepID=UPI0021E994E6|nr:cryptochrome/photolyase family protein [Lentibacter sp. XHP0401]MCV2892264.1 cryptochrome/photolyase family protein [Lentibacter sp. XHP0401]
MSRTDLILVLGDQLSHGLSALDATAPERAVVLMAEVAEEADYVWHHKKKLAFVFSAMRHFAEELRTAGWEVRYRKLEDKDNKGSLAKEVAALLETGGFARVLMTEAGELRVNRAFEEAGKSWPVPLEVLADNRFLASHEEFRSWAEGRKQLRMEYFYREMRRKTGLLMQGDTPEGGQWNFDAENRKPAKADLFMPRPPQTEPDAITQEVLEMVERERGGHFGALTPFWFAVERSGALEALEDFAREALPRFGDYQDAMLTGEPFLYHSVLAQYINIGLLEPLEVCRRVERAYYEGHAPLNAVEGFIRQIIGWREYMRGIYWLNPEGYTEQNFLGANRDLPAFYWTGDTDMACMKAAIGQTMQEAYAHHIQRLMVTGNFAMLAGIEPKQVHEWYLAVYADAYEWVEAPNVIGMSQFADGGFLGSKPYAASGNYINKMSDYCGGCRYSVSKKTGEGACPFNALYWDFLARNESKLKGNPRLGQMYATWARMSEDTQRAYRDSAAAFLERL